MLNVIALMALITTILSMLALVHVLNAFRVLVTRMGRGAVAQEAEQKGGRLSAKAPLSVEAAGANSQGRDSLP